MKKLIAASVICILVSGITAAEALFTLGVGSDISQSYVASDDRIETGDKVRNEHTFETGELAFSASALVTIRSSGFGVFAGLMLSSPDAFKMTTVSEEANYWDKETTSVDKGYILQPRIGLGYLFFADRPLKLLVGAGYAGFVSELTYRDSSSRETVSLKSAYSGFFETVRLHYYFSAKVGAFLDWEYATFLISDTYKFQSLDDAKNSMDLRDGFHNAATTSFRAGVAFRL